MKGRSLCQEHWNEYMRDFRSRSVSKREKTAHHRGFLEGIEKCVQLLRRSYGERALTGYQMARFLELQVSPETPEQVQRQAFLATLRTPLRSD